jgi:hypothetical protein
MKKSFKEYYPLSSEEKKKIWDEATFIFDANILLDLYQYSEKTRKEFLGILDNLSDRIWLPHQFALEYQRRRLNVIEKQFAFYKHVSDQLDKGFNLISHEIKKDQQQHPFLKIDKILKRINSSIKSVSKEISNSKNKHPNWFEKDPIRDHIDKLFEDKVGFPCKDIENVEKEGSNRFSKKIPPGYEDAKKDNGNPYGDWIGWYQIIEMVKNMQEKKPIILVTNDNKKDWWLKISEKTMGPRPELIKEMLINDTTFYMYTMEMFLKIATPIYKIKKTTIEEIKEINKKNIPTENELSEQIPPTSGVEFSVNNIAEEAGEQDAGITIS